MRRAWLSGPAAPLIGAAAGLAAAVLVTLLQEPTYRTDASIVLVRQGQPPGSDPQLAGAASAAAELFDTRAVAASAIENLGLDESPDELIERVDVRSEADSSLVRIEVAAPTRDGARRTAQELAEVSTVLFNDRFGPQTVASVWEPAGAEGKKVAPDPARNLALGALLGALAGWIPLLLGGRRPVRRPIAPARAQPQTSATAPREPVTAPAPASPPPAAPAPEPPHQRPAGPFVVPHLGEWTIWDIERLLAEHGSEFPDLLDELGFYLESFRGVAAADGRLPGGVEGVFEQVFGPLIQRARVTGAEAG